MHVSAVCSRWMVLGAVDIESPLFPGSFLSIIVLIYFFCLSQKQLKYIGGTTTMVLPFPAFNNAHLEHPRSRLHCGFVHTSLCSSVTANEE
jgi:hypothetical protein